MGKKGFKNDKSFNDRFFWHCYDIEQGIVTFLHRKAEVPLQAITASIVALSVVLTAIPGVVSAEFPVSSLVVTILEPIHPAVGFTTASLLPLQNQTEEGEFKKGVIYGVLPQSPLKEPKKVINGVITFYCSEPRYTDSTPFITANGTRVRFGIVASNIVRFNTRVQIPEVFGDTSFVVMDRMNPRYNRKPFFDIWVETCEEARERGVHYTTVEIYS